MTFVTEKSTVQPKKNAKVLSSKNFKDESKYQGARGSDSSSSDQSSVRLGADFNDDSDGEISSNWSAKDSID